MLVFFDDEQLLEIKIIDLYLMLKIKISLMGCEKDIGSTQNKHF